MDSNKLNVRSPSPTDKRQTALAMSRACPYPVGGHRRRSTPHDTHHTYVRIDIKYGVCTRTLNNATPVVTQRTRAMHTRVTYNEPRTNDTTYDTTHNVEPLTYNVCTRYTAYQV